MALSSATARGRPSPRTLQHRRGADGDLEWGAPGKPDLTLDDLATAHFRGILGEGSIALYPELEDCYYNSGFLQMVRDYWGARSARPTLMLFNLCGPHHSGLNAHLDAVTFRGVRIENSPVWLQNVMGRSGLFTEHLVKMAQVITWWYRGEEGTFTYWPDGPLGQPKRLEHPLWNKGVVVQNEMMFHRGDPVGRPDSSATRPASSTGRSSATTPGATTGKSPPTGRSSGATGRRRCACWCTGARELYCRPGRGQEEPGPLRRPDPRRGLRAPARRPPDSGGCEIAEPSDPLHDQAFIRALIATYSVAPTTDWARTAA